MNADERGKLEAIQALISELLAMPPASTSIRTPADLDRALAAAKIGDTLTLSSDLVYPAPLTLTRSVHLVSEAPGQIQMDLDAPAPRFVNGIRCSSDDVTLVGLEVRHTNPLTDIVVNTGARFVMDRCKVLGDAVAGGKRGIALNGGPVQTVMRSYVADIFQPAQDTQAICAWDALPGITIEDCYLEAAGQSVMFGGADSQSVARIPRSIRITDCTLTKKPEWFGHQQIKCALELKCVIDIIVDSCHLEYAGTAQGQGAYLIVVTPRNQGGKAPWSTVQLADIRNCTGRYAGGILNVLGSDNNNPSGTVDSLVLEHCGFTEIDPKGITGGSGRLFMFDRAPKNVELDDIMVGGQNLAALGYFDGAMPVGLVLQQLKFPTSKYGWKIDGGGSGRKALQAAMPDAKMDDTIV